MQLLIDQEFKSLIPPLTPEEYSQLEDNIKQEGCRDALVLWNGILVDGHNRYEICQAHGILFDTTTIDLEDRDAAITWIINNQLGRRNLNPIQISSLRGKQYHQEKKAVGRPKEEENKFPQNEGIKNPHIETHTETAERLAKEFKVSRATIERDGQLAEALEKISEATDSFDLQRSFLSHDTKLTKEAVITIAELPKEEIQKVAAMEDREILAAAKEIRATKQAERRKERIQKIIEITQNNPDLDGSIGQYPVIYADPPWEYEFCSDDADRIDNHYPTMSLDEIKQLPIKDITTPDCILFLWTTSPKLKEALEVLEAWGFTYKTCAVWVKDRIGMGYYFRQKHELLLVGTKGNIPTPDPSNRPPSVQFGNFDGHSKKPHLFYDLIEKMYQELPKIELFCRSPREGWKAWGNQV